MRNDRHEWSAVEKITSQMIEIQTADVQCPQCAKLLMLSVDKTPIMPLEHRVRLDCWGCGYWTLM
jgi:C4-type Zn-finger protein